MLVPRIAVQYTAVDFYRIGMGVVCSGAAAFAAYWLDCLEPLCVSQAGGENPAAVNGTKGR